MKWYELKPVKRGDVLQLTVRGVSGQYRVLRNVDDAMDLRLCDLELVRKEADNE